jgi:transposase InsO family protein
LRGFIDAHRDVCGVEPICKVLQIAPSGYRRFAAQRRNPELRCARARRDDILMPEIQRVWQANMQVYGADKVWHQLNREHDHVARCTVERLMRRMGLQGVQRGKTVRTTIPDTSVPSAIQGGTPKSAMGIGLYPCFDLARLVVRGLRH